MATEPKTGLGSWRLRRVYMWAVSIVCVWVIAYVLVKELDTRPADTAMMMAFIVLMGCVGSYVFGAVWDDKNKMEFLGARLGEQMDDRQSLKRAVVRSQAARIAEERMSASEDVLDEALEEVGKPK